MVSFNIEDHFGTKDFPRPTGNEISPEQWKRDMKAFTEIVEFFRKTAAMDCAAHREAYDNLMESTILPLLLYGAMCEWYNTSDMSDDMKAALAKYIAKHTAK